METGLKAMVEKCFRSQGQGGKHLCPKLW